MRLCCSFRSLHISCIIFTTALVNVPGWLIRHHPGDPGSRQENRRVADYSPHPWGSPLRGQRERSSKLLQTILSSAYSFRLSGRAPACIHAGYALGPEHRFNVFTSLCLFPAARKMMHFIPVSYVKKQRSFSFDLMPPFRQFQTVLHISSIFSRRCVTKLVSFPEVFRMRTYNDERQ